MKEVLLVLIILTLAKNARLALAPLADVEDIASKCLSGISNKYFATGQITNIVFTNYKEKEKMNSVKDQILASYFKELKMSLIVQTQFDRPYIFNSQSKPHNYIIYIKQIEEIQSMLAYLKQSLTWNPLGNFVLASMTVFENTTEVATKIIKTMWSFRILNLIVILPHSSENKSLLLYSWFPYEKGKCGNAFSAIKIINICKAGHLGNGTALFAPKVPNNLNGCMVKARVVGVPPFVMVPNLDRNKTNLEVIQGLEISLLDTVAKAANFRVNYSMSNLEFDWGKLEEINSSVVSTGMMKLLLDGEIDIGFGCIGGTPMRYKYFEQSISYFQDYLTWCVPHALVKPKWKCVFNIFQSSTWALTFLTLILATLSFWGLSFIIQNESQSYTILQRCTTNTFSVLLGISVVQPRGGFSRIFFIIWVIFSLHWTTSYQTSLISVLTHPSYEKQISEMEDIFNSELRYGFVRTAVRYFEDKNDWRMRKIHEHWVPCDNGFICLQNIAYSRNYALAISKKFLEYNDQKFRDKDGKSMLFLFKNNIVSFPIQMLISRGFPFIHRLNELILRVYEAGLLIIWFRKLLWQQKNDAISSDDETHKLSVSNLHGSFLILAFGLGAATVVFIFEIIVHYRKQDKVHLIHNITNLETIQPKQLSPIHLSN